MVVHPRRCFVDVFLLQDQGDRFLRSYRCPGKLERLLIDRESAEVVVAFRLVQRFPLWVHPDTIFEHGVPDKASAGASACGIGAYKIRIEYGWILTGFHRAADGRKRFVFAVDDFAGAPGICLD